MAKANTHEHMNRLDQLSSMLKSGEYLTIRELAADLNVSRRTLQRDINILRDRGLPIDTDKGRGGGIRLHRSWGIGRLTLSDQEAIDLLMSLAIAAQMQSPLFMASLKGVRHKLMASFSSHQKFEIDTLRERIRVGGSASTATLSSSKAVLESSIKPLNRAFLFKQQLEIKYRRADKQLSTRIIEPHHLYLNYPMWYILAWDDLRQDYRTFRCDRIEEATICDASFKLRPFTEFQHMVEGDIHIYL